MPVIAGFDKLASAPEEQITDKTGRREISGKQRTMVHWTMQAAHTPQQNCVSAMRRGRLSRATLPSCRVELNTKRSSQRTRR